MLAWTCGRVRTECSLSILMTVGRPSECLLFLLHRRRSSSVYFTGLASRFRFVVGPGESFHANREQRVLGPAALPASRGLGYFRSDAPPVAPGRILGTGCRQEGPASVLYLPVPV